MTEGPPQQADEIVETRTPAPAGMFQTVMASDEAAARFVKLWGGIVLASLVVIFCGIYFLLRGVDDKLFSLLTAVLGFGAGNTRSALRTPERKKTKQIKPPWVQ